MTHLPLLLTAELGAPQTPARPLLVVGPSLGTSAAALWGAAAQRLSDRFTVIGFDLPGHGVSAKAAPAADMAVLARAVLAAVDAFQAKSGATGQGFFYAGVSVSGCIGLQLLLDAPDRVERAVILNSAAKIGEASGWRERAELVRTQGCAVLREASAGRWFAPGFTERDPATAAALLDSLCATDAAGYAGVCEALAAFDVRARLPEIAAPTLAIGGRDDLATPPEAQQAIAAGVRHGRAEILAATAHLAPAEQPDAVTGLIAGFLDAR